jgi:hypothetical protein
MGAFKDSTAEEDEPTTRTSLPDKDETALTTDSSSSTTAMSRRDFAHYSLILVDASRQSYWTLGQRRENPHTRPERREAFRRFLEG